MKQFFTALAFTCFAIPLSAQPGTNDPSFNPTDPGYRRGDGVSGSVMAMAVQPDGRILLGGNINTYNDQSYDRLLRLLPDGLPDPSFDVGTGANSPVFCFATQPDGKILVGGGFVVFNGVPGRRLVRLEANGSLDPTFAQEGTGFSGSVNEVVVQADGKLVVAGAIFQYNGVPCGSICRLNADGSLDESFASGSGFDGNVECMVQQPDGRILVGGSFDSYNALPAQGVCRLNADGTLDGSFDPGSGTADGDQVLSIALGEGGTVMVAGDFNTFNGVAAPNIIRLLASGSVDATFNVGSGFSGTVEGVVITPDNKYVVFGSFLNFGGEAAPRIIRLLNNGGQDPAFNVGVGPDAVVRSAVALADGSVLVGGDFDRIDQAGPAGCIILLGDGSVDPDFNKGTAVGTLGATVLATARQSDGKLLLGGRFYTYDGVRRRNICRVHPDGALDETFQVGTGFDGEVRAIAITADGKIVVGGTFTTYDGTARTSICRLNADGSLDESFYSGGTLSGFVNCLAIQPDGRILVGGDFDGMGTLVRRGLIRLSADGAPNALFNTGEGTASEVFTIALQPDGKVLVGGSFVVWDGNGNYDRLVRLNTNGSIDDTFSYASGFNGIVRSIAVEPSGRMFVGGEFTTFDGAPANHIARLNADGGINAVFDSGIGFDDDVLDLALLPDGRLIASGLFNTYQALEHNDITCLEADGDLSPGFSSGEGTNSGIQTLTVLPEGKVLIGGSFSAYNTIGRNRIARLFITGGVGEEELTPDKPAITVGPNPAQDVLLFSNLPVEARTVRVMDVNGALVRETRVRSSMDVRNLAPGPYVFSVLDAQGATLSTSRIVVAR
ncbi:MAG: hypothetical protein JNM91_05545 [Flavobacteriales bacterium]|nr:hypothetical protein [Flavobacteriales bacterium]